MSPSAGASGSTTAVTWRSTTALASAHEALAGRRERALLDEPSVAAVAQLLAARCRQPASWIRAAVGTLGRFAAEVADADLAGLLARGRADPAVAEDSLAGLARRHNQRTAGQLESLAFGPKLWWRLNGVAVSWRPLAKDAGPVAGPVLTARGTGLDARILLLALIGTGATEAELLAVRVRDAGSLDADGALRPDLTADPLAFEFRPEEGGEPRLSFLSHAAAIAVRERLDGRRPRPDDPLLLPPRAVTAARRVVAARSSALIAAGNDVNVATCRATGDFFRAWGMPGARFESRMRGVGSREGSMDDEGKEDQ